MNHFKTEEIDFLDAESSSKYYLLILLWLALASVAWGISDVVRGLSDGMAGLVVLGGLLVGWEVARRRWALWLGAVAGMLAGVMTVGLLVGGVWRLLWAWLWHSVLWIGYGLYAMVFDVGEMANEGQVGLLTERSEAAWWALWDGIGAIGARFIDWFSASTTGEAGFDPLASALVWGMTLWLVALWAGWRMRQRQAALEALLPAGILLLGTLSFFVASIKIEMMLLFLAITLILIAMTGQLTREKAWEAEGIGYSEEIKKDLLRITVLISLLLALLASVIPSVSIWEFTEAIQRTFIKPLRQSAPIAALLELEAPGTIGFGGFGTGFGGNGSYGSYGSWQAPTLPRRHLIGSGPELSEEVVMLMQTDDLSSGFYSVGQAIPQYYWRSLTYDTYTGNGWMTNETETVGFEAGQVAIAERLPFQRQVKQQVDKVVDGDSLLYTGGRLLTVNQDFSIAFRSEGDMFGGLIRSSSLSSSSSYEAHLLVPQFTPNLLRQAGTDYPKWIEERYLVLPETVPHRVSALAKVLTAQAKTPYDKARAIESYLKRFPYTLDLPAPPSERDLADYFLFELERGYCDYYATTMVVLARAAGIPARLATGYASGSYDEQQNRYIVTEADAHSWAEVYFPSRGWLPFEPTGGGDAVARAGLIETILPPNSSQMPFFSFIGRISAPWWLGLATIVTIVLGASGWLMADVRRLRRQPPAETIIMVYQRLKSHAKSLNLRLNSEQTPYEMASQLSSQLEKLAFEHKRWAKELAPVRQEVEQLTHLYVRVSYAEYQPDKAIQQEVVKNWLHLRRRLWLARLVRFFANRKKWRRQACP